MAGLFEPQPPPVNTNSGSTQSPTSSGEVEIVKNELIMIPGGKFTMGRDVDGKQGEDCAHEVEVKEFWIDKYEVTNAEYYDFVKANDYKTPTQLDYRRQICRGRGESAGCSGFNYRC